VGTLHKIGKISSSLQQEFGREPSAKSDTLKISNSHLSLDAPFSVSEDNSLIDILEDEMQPSPDESLLDDSLRVEIEKALDTLTPREAEVINLYFGLNQEKPLTLEEIGARFSLTRERVRQIKEKAIRRLRHASRSKALRAYLN
jgi:RNA polymerase primary sigma factor